MSLNTTELDTGNVFVQIKSKRGTGTRDQDEVIVQATYTDVETAQNQSSLLNQMLKERMAEVREMGDPPEIEDEFEIPNEDEYDYSKVYLGEGSRMSGWIPVDRRIVFEKIAPLASKNTVEDEDSMHINVNFSKDVPLSGWNKVDASVVSKQIEPLIREHRVDK